MSSTRKSKTPHVITFVAHVYLYADHVGWIVNRVDHTAGLVGSVGADRMEPGENGYEELRALLMLRPVTWWGVDHATPMATIPAGEFEQMLKAVRGELLGEATRDG